ncbi:unnamed protein product [Allacma fusca]|uniref:Uncharacterized protein n=1 Tax=Allacma fusca TaxID=39272 RepID=A0A8J2L8S2_9HEXA|nr:unnamed protein product [Allacma fusca]
MHLLVEWLNEDPKCWSVVSKDQLSDGTLRKSKELLGRTVGIKWKRKVIQAVVVDSGDEMLLEAQADNLAKELHQRENNLPNNQRKRRGSTLLVHENPVSSSSRSENVKQKSNAKVSRVTQIQSVLKSIDPDVPETFTEPAEPSLDVIPDDEPTIDWVEKYVDCKSKLRALRTKYKLLKEVHGRCTNGDDYVELWEGSDLRFKRSEISA